MPGPVSSLRVELPYPPAGLSPNSRLHWRAKAQLTAHYREDAGWAAIKARSDATRDNWLLRPPVEAHVVFYVPDKRRRDQDNLLAMLKPAWDGMVDAGLLVDDDAAHFRVGAVSIEVGTPRVVVMLKRQEVSNE